jgi:hypothetical protein
MTTEQKQMTVSEFKSWMAGIREMNGDEWVPSAEQWKKICDKIETLKDTPTSFNQAQPAAGPTYRAMPPAESNVTLPMPAPQNDIPLRPAAPSMLNAAPSMPNVPRMITSPGGVPVLKGPFAQDMPGQPIKTPSIDTTNGQYDSSFV